MLGRTHYAASTVTGTAALLLLYHGTLSSDEQIKTFSTDFTQNVLHLSFDTLSFLTFGLWFAGFILLIGFGALLPDIDSKKSKLGRYVPFVQDMIGHRTLTHTVWALLFLSVIAFFINGNWPWLIVVGYFLHIVQDSFSVQGIDWLWPIVNKKKKHLKLYRVGGFLEDFVYGSCIIGHMYIISQFAFSVAWV